jgi:hypothetical protein
MCDIQDINNEAIERVNLMTVPVEEAIGMVLRHDITEIRKGEFKGRAFKKGHIIKEEDIPLFKRLGKENLFVLNISIDEMHEDEAAYALANALMGEGVKIDGEPNEGKINIVAARDGLLKINKHKLTQFNMLGTVMCATLHNNTVVKKGQIVAGTRAIPLVIKRKIVEEAVRIAKGSNGQELDGSGVIEVKKLLKPKVGIVITGNEVYYGRIEDAFAPILKKKIERFDGEIIDIYYAPDREDFIEERLRKLIFSGADLLITTGGMSVDPDDVTRFAIKRLGATEITYGAAMLPGAMFLIAYLERIPIIGIPACGMYHKITIFDLILPRVLAGEKIGRQEIAELGHGGLCLQCKKCTYPVCPFGK